MNGFVFQINASDGGVPKRPQAEGVVTPEGLSGDHQRDLVHHGGPDRALCLYSLERILALQQEGHPIFPGSVGENLTLRAISWLELTPGSRWRIGDSAVIEITRYTTPCKHIAESFLEGKFARIQQDSHPGWSRVYAKVLRPGRIRIGDRVRSED